MASNIVRITERGQISIPASIRKQAKLQSGQTLQWELLTNREFRLVMVQDVNPVGAFAMLGYAKQFNLAETRSVDEIMAELRAGDRDGED